MKKIIKIQFFILLIGTIFSWSNFVIALFDWLNRPGRTADNGLSSEINNPFLTPDFYNAVFFLIVFLLSLILLFMNRDRKKKKEESSGLTGQDPASLPADEE